MSPDGGSADVPTMSPEGGAMLDPTPPPRPTDPPTERTPSPTPGPRTPVPTEDSDGDVAVRRNLRNVFTLSDRDTLATQGKSSNAFASQNFKLSSTPKEVCLEGIDGSTFARCCVNVVYNGEEDIVEEEGVVTDPAV
ncbi:MAG: hypothetical protein SGARI_006277 [Bacillariaceae sp.]